MRGKFKYGLSAIENWALTKKMESDFSGAVLSVVATVFIFGLIATPFGLIATPTQGPVLIPHAPIFIDGDREFTASNGVRSGTGTPQDPYVIERWEIAPSGFQNGVEIRNTTASFVVRNVSVRLGHFGIVLTNVSNGLVENAEVFDNLRGIVLETCTAITIQSNDIVNYSEGNGIFLNSCIDVTVSGNRLSSNLGTGIFLDSSTNVTISGNDIANKGFGMVFFSSADVTLTNNTVFDSRHGVIIAFSTEFTLASNTFRSGGIFIDGDSLRHFDSHTILRSNSVDGRPVYYYRGCMDLDLTGIPVGQLILIRCTNVRAVGLQIANASVGIQVAFSEGVLILGSAIQTTTRYGILLQSVTNATIANNDLTGNDGTSVEVRASVNVTLSTNRLLMNGNSITLLSSTNVTIAGNTLSNGRNGVYSFSSAIVTVVSNSISGHSVGLTFLVSGEINIMGNHVLSSGRAISITGSTDIIIARNRAASSVFEGIIFESVRNASIQGNALLTNGHGIRLKDSTGIIVHRNNLVDNRIQASDDRGFENSWDDDYPNGGNYWSDYRGMDDCSGRNQSVCPPPDGIGDVPYVIDVDSRDNYPSMEPRNSPPLASFVLSPDAGNVAAVFVADASSSMDAEEPTTALEVRWDWQDDGIWDTPWTLDKTARHQFAEPGTFAIRLEVRDSSGLTDSTTRMVVVAPLPPDGVTPSLYLAIGLIVIIVAIPLVTLASLCRRKQKVGPKATRGRLRRR